jgi:hypothetical protein
MIYVATYSDAASHQIIRRKKKKNRSPLPPNLIKVYLLYAACCLCGHDLKKVKLGILPKNKHLWK